MCYNYFCKAGAIMYIGMPQLYEYDDIEDNFKLASKSGLDFIELNLNFFNLQEYLNKNDISEFVKKYNINITLHFLEKCLPILKKLL